MSKPDIIMLRLQLIAHHWEKILRLAASTKDETVTASLILRKPGAYPRQPALAQALRECGRMEHTIFTLQCLQDLNLRRQVHVGLNKGES